MPKIIVELPENRKFVGRLRLVDDYGIDVIEPMDALGRADYDTARLPPPKGYDNPTLDWRKSGGHTPLGGWQVVGLRFTTDTFILRHGPYKLELKAISGDALLAKDREHIQIHSGFLDPVTGELRPTSGCIRISDEDMARLLDGLTKYKEDSQRCEIISVETKTGRTGAERSDDPPNDPPSQAGLLLDLIGARPPGPFTPTTGPRVGFQPTPPKLQSNLGGPVAEPDFGGGDDGKGDGLGLGGLGGGQVLDDELDTPGTAGDGRGRVTVPRKIGDDDKPDTPGEGNGDGRGRLALPQAGGGEDDGPDHTRDDDGDGRGRGKPPRVIGLDDDDLDGTGRDDGDGRGRGKPPPHGGGAGAGDGPRGGDGDGAGPMQTPPGGAGGPPTGNGGGGDGAPDEPSEDGDGGPDKPRGVLGGGPLPTPLDGPPPTDDGDGAPDEPSGDDDGEGDGPPGGNGNGNVAGPGGASGPLPATGGGGDDSPDEPNGDGDGGTGGTDTGGTGGPTGTGGGGKPIVFDEGSHVWGTITPRPRKPEDEYRIVKRPVVDTSIVRMSNLRSLRPGPTAALSVMGEADEVLKVWEMSQQTDGLSATERARFSVLIDLYGAQRTNGLATKHLAKQIVRLVQVRRR